jgi:type VI secretion system Hcp family effector
MQIEGVQGLFEVEDYSFDMEQTLQIGSQSSGAGAGKITFNPFSITRKVDVPSPSLFNACANGKHFPSVTLHVRKAGGSQEFYVVKLTDVFLTSYRTSGAGPGKTESATVNFARAELEHAPAAVALAPTPVPPRITGVTPDAASIAPKTAVTFAVVATGDCARSRIDFGDGSPVVEYPILAGKSQPAPTHEYAKGGTFEVKAYGLADPMAKLPVPPKASDHWCTGHATTSVVVKSTMALAPAVRK